MQRNFSGAFTLIELLIVITIIIILASIAYPVYTNVQERARATQDLNNLRQIGLATQMYLNDNDNVIFSADPAADPWMKLVHAKYLPGWKIFQSPFDKRTASEDDTTAPVSYGINGNTTNRVTGLQADKIVKPSVFILLGPAQSDKSTVDFFGTAGTGAPGVTVYKDDKAKGGTHSGRKRINALFADLHTESIAWSVFKNDTKTSNDPEGDYRWDYAGK